ncbi:hypothetical protein ATI61_11391 [Archangium gephyra]|uniref:Phage tail sheath protein FI n=1 Tax=Archangium gephyra TaxID=48 RepID=A0AAC8Q894_9BACT|nr:phage tail sheath subtilisin-like domain-containing protein [Archangium gephyra]AKJ02902.1 Phage tail sheath protein FI [Archangium gephyra]REG25028.1 hypothetical protein ATI61_11391 [Archangium gephyra]
MPEYLAPGVFVEETSFRSKSIEGVSTTTTGFIGPTSYGPILLENELVTSVSEYERTYGDRRQLTFEGTDTHHNFMWHAVRAFFEEGGKRLYISRVFRNLDKSKYTGFQAAGDPRATTPHNDGHARALLDPSVSDSSRTLLLHARYPGSAGNVRVSITLRVSQNILSFVPSDGKDVPRVSGLSDRDVVLIRDPRPSDATGPVGGTFHLTHWNKDSQTWSFSPSSGPDLALADFQKPQGRELHIITATVAIAPIDDPGASIVWDGLALDPAHTRAGSPDSFTERFIHDENNPSRNREVPIVIDPGELNDGLELLQALLNTTLHSPPRSPPLDMALEDPDSPDEERTVTVVLQGGNDGSRPTSGDYQGEEVPDTTQKTGLFQFQDLEDISIVAAPGSTFGYQTEDQGYGPEAATIVNLLISHCQRMKYRIAVLDSGNGQTIAQVRRMRARIDSSHAALYYPWVKVRDPVTQQSIHLPPSGFVAGIYARNDEERAVYKAPANEVVNLAVGFEVMLNKAQQEVLNPEGINAFRFFEGRGFRLWGARTTSSDPEWKYVNLRRYFAFLERSIDKGTQWAVFEPNGPQLWANVRRTIEDFLLNEWQSGALLGDKPEKAYFVRCDRSTMSQNDLDNGRLVCLVGVAPLRPAEFVIFRIGQWTGDRR